MTPEDRAAQVMERWRRQVVDTTTPFSGDEVLARDIAEAIREAREECAVLADAHQRQYEAAAKAIRDADDGEESPEADKAWIECEAYEAYAAGAKEIAAAIRAQK